MNRCHAVWPRSRKQPFGKGDSNVPHVSNNNDNSNNSTSDNHSEHNNDNDNSSNSTSDSHSEHNNDNDNEMPDVDVITEAISQLDVNNPIRRSYESLFKHFIWPKPKDYDEDWKPFRNCLCYMLWLGLNDPNLSMTRNTLQWILNLLMTLKSEGVFKDDNYWIPTDASTITKYKRYFPNPPLC